MFGFVGVSHCVSRFPKTLCHPFEIA